MARKSYWNGFTAGTAAGVGATIGALLLINGIGRARGANIVRLQKTLQIGRPVQEVFTTWADLGKLPQWSSIVRSIERNGNRSHWIVEIDGRRLEWDAEVEQYVPNQAIGWKSLNGPKHTGRISFSPLGNDTLISVTMNYSPSFRLFRPFAASMSTRMESYMDQVLRDFKAAMEGKRSEAAAEHRFPTATRATGTFGGFTNAPGPAEHENFPGTGTPLEQSRPVETKS